MAAPAPVIASVCSATTRPFTVLAHENQVEFDRLLAAHRAEHHPTTEHQRFLVAQLAVNQWLLERARRFESRALDLLAGTDPNPSDPDSRIVARMLETNPKSLAAIQKSAAQAERSYYRAHRELMASKLEQQNEPNPEPNKPNPTFTPVKTKPSLRSQYPENLALCL